MYMTVEDALSVYPLSEGTLIAGKAGLRRIVKSVNVMDAPDIADWVHEGEVLFTTAYLLKDNPGEAEMLIGKLARKGAAALGIKLGRFWTEVPPSILKEADRIGFPIIELPYPFTFSDQMNGLFRAEMSRTTLRLKQVMEKQQALIRFALGRRREDFFGELASILNCSMAVVLTGKRVLFSSLSISDEQLLEAGPWSSSSSNKRRRESMLSYYPLPVRQQSQSLAQGGFAVIQPKSPELHPLKEEEGLYVQAAEMIACHLEELEQHRQEREQSELPLVVQSYLNRTISIDAVLECACTLENPFIQKPFRCLWTTASGTEQRPAGDPLALRAVRQEFLYHPQLKQMALLHIEMGPALLSIISCGSAADEERLVKLLYQLFAGSDQEPGAGRPLRFFVSSLKQTPDQLAEAYEECLSAAETARSLDINQLVVDYRTLEFADLFSSVSSAKMTQFCTRLLAPILEKPPDTAGEMLSTLRLYLQHNGQTAEAAKDLFVHRNTVAYRLDKISELLQMDLRNYEHLLKLKLAFLFQEFLSREGRI
ncbi:PucR family transcriptional regulator [Paenibacillus pinistramenti]|uniref:PucR family transcriptional regulator n=1 Tax=Paenibacillus pinistramenti TaxID=1768003 RepID=UPI001109C7D1|nr:PucR family transcriptional regulator [Paenibacillus pinistramenti]